MNEFKKYIHSRFALTMVLIVVLIISLPAMLLFLLIKARPGVSALYKDLVVVGIYFACVLILVILEIRQHRVSTRILREASEDPALMENLITDFQNAESLWDGRVMVGEKYVFLKGTAILHRIDADCFYYHGPGYRKYNYSVYLRTKLQRRAYVIAFTKPGQYTDSTMRAAIEEANHILKKE